MKNINSSIIKKQVPIIQGPTGDELEKSYDSKDDSEPFCVRVATEQFSYLLRIFVLAKSDDEGYYFTGIIDDDGHIQVSGVWDPDTQNGYIMV